MKAEDFEIIIEEQIAKCKDILCTKAEEYASNSNRLHNFYVASELQNVSPMRALSGMMAKHTISIYDLCDMDHLASKELWDEKITDSINYLLLLQAVVHEERSKLGFDEPLCNIYVGTLEIDEEN